MKGKHLNISSEKVFDIVNNLLLVLIAVIMLYRCGTLLSLLLAVARHWQKEDSSSFQKNIHWKIIARF